MPRQARGLPGRSKGTRPRRNQRAALFTSTPRSLRRNQLLSSPPRAPAMALYPTLCTPQSAERLQPPCSLRRLPAAAELAGRGRGRGRQGAGVGPCAAPGAAAQHSAGVAPRAPRATREATRTPCAPVGRRCGYVCLTRPAAISKSSLLRNTKGGVRLTRPAAALPPSADRVPACVETARPAAARPELAGPPATRSLG